LGLTLNAVESVSSEKVQVGFFGLGNKCSLELLEPSDENSPITKFLKNRGQGIHHICLRVGDIHQAIKDLTSQGIQMIDSQPKKGAHNCKVAFVHPKSTGGVLIELSQHESGDEAHA
jgi:methylmalonyl-CoA epimerase